MNQQLLKAAVVFLGQKVRDCIQTKMLTASRRVAAIKSVSIPRLGICAALLGSYLVEAVSAAINDKRFRKPKKFCRSDSTVTTAWLQDNPRRWSTFVAKRVAKMKEVIPATDWEYVPTENTADYFTKDGIR